MQGRTTDRRSELPYLCKPLELCESINYASIPGRESPEEKTNALGHSAVHQGQANGTSQTVLMQQSATCWGSTEDSMQCSRREPDLLRSQKTMAVNQGDTPAFRPVGRRLSLQRRHPRLPQSQGRPAAPGCAPELRQRTSESIITPGLGSGSRRCPCLSMDCPCQHHAAAGDLQTVPYSCKGLRREELRGHGSRLRLHASCCPACKVAQHWHNDVMRFSCSHQTVRISAQRAFKMDGKTDPRREGSILDSLHSACARSHFLA